MGKITRSAGLIVEMGHIPFAVGSGYRGATEELDALVQAAAEGLHRLFPRRDIEIRFNSDRRSGSAWLMNHRPGISGNADVGVGAGLRPQRPAGFTDEEWWAMPRADISQLPDVIYIDTVVRPSSLRNPTMAARGNEDNRYSYEEHPSVEAALAWLAANVDEKEQQEVAASE